MLGGGTTAGVAGGAGGLAEDSAWKTERKCFVNMLIKIRLNCMFIIKLYASLFVYTGLKESMLSIL